MTVESNAILQMVYGLQITTTPDEWKRRLPNALIWFDYMSIPQPGAGSDGKSSDHRLAEGVADDVVEQLRDAVDSIPTFVERCSMMWVLAPPCRHADVEDQICDFSSWRSRGWCRLEYAAAKLSRGDDMQIMVISNIEATPEYFNPCDTMKLAATRGVFAVDDDRIKVSKTLQTMLDAKVANYEALDDMTLARVLRAFAPIFLPKADSESTAGGGIEHVKTLFHWRDEATEAAWQKHTGWNLLTLACAVDDETAVTELLATDEGRAMISSRGIMEKKKLTPLRIQPFSKLLMDLLTGMTPLMAAVTFSRPVVISALLDAGAPMPVGVKLFGDNPCQFRGMFAGKIDNLRLLLSRFPELASKVNQAGASACAFACMLSRDQCQVDILKDLLDHGAASTLGVEHMAYGTPLMILSQNLDADPAAVSLLHEAAPNGRELLETKGTLHKAWKAIAPLMAILRLFGVNAAKGVKRITTGGPGNIHPNGATAMHIAAQRGHISMVKAMADLPSADQAILQARDKYGHTPLERARHTAAPTHVEALEPVLEGDATVDTLSKKAGGKGGSWVSVAPPAQVLPKEA